MEAAVALKLTVSEFDTLRAALDSYVERMHEQTRLGATAREKQKARAAETKAKALVARLNA